MVFTVLSKQKPNFIIMPIDDVCVPIYHKQKIMCSKCYFTGERTTLKQTTLACSRLTLFVLEYFWGTVDTKELDAIV